MNYPEEIMTEVAWSFVGKKYRTQEEFIEAVTAYNEKFGKGQWDPNAIAIQSKKIKLVYSYWDYKEEDDEYESVDLVSTADAFTNAELLFKIHNAIVNKLKKNDEHFFDGLIFWEEETEFHPQIPSYLLAPDEMQKTY